MSERLKLRRRVRRPTGETVESEYAIDDPEDVRRLREAGLPPIVETQSVEEPRFERISVGRVSALFKVSPLLQPRIRMGRKEVCCKLTDQVRALFEAGAVDLTTIRLEAERRFEGRHIAQAVFVTLYELGLSEKRIHEITGYSESTVRTYLYEARRRLMEPIPIRRIRLLSLRSLRPSTALLDVPAITEARLPRFRQRTISLEPPKPERIIVGYAPGLRAKPKLVGACVRPLVEVSSLKPRVVPVEVPEAISRAISIRMLPEIEEVRLGGIAGRYSLLRAVFGGRYVALRSRYVGEPVILVIPPEREGFELRYLVLAICRELYREARGGLPKPFVLKNVDALKEQVFQLGDRLAGKIVFIEGKFEPEELVEEQNALLELLSQSLCFLVVRGGEDLAERIRGGSYPFKPLVITIPAVVTAEAAERIINSVMECWRIREHIAVHSNAIEEILSEAERRYRDAIYSLLDSRYAWRLKRGSAEETEDHLALKALAIKHLVEECDVPIEEIECEHPFDEKVVADVFAKPHGLAVEVETLYGAGASPLLSVKESVLKYRGKGVREVWVIVRNFSLAMHAPELWKLRKLLREELKNEFKVEFFVPDLTDLRLVPIADVLRNLLHRESSLKLK